MTTRKRTRYVTDVVVLQYPHLVDPDTKFDPDGVFRTSIIYPESMEVRLASTGAPAGTMVEVLQGVMDEARAEMEEQRKGKRPLPPREPFEPQMDETNTHTGNLVSKLKTKAIYTARDGSTRRRQVPIFDSKGRPTLPTQIWSGTRARVSFTAAPFQATMGYGVTLYLDGVQIIELVRGGNDAGAHGFGVEDEGYEAESAFTPMSDSVASSGVSSDDDF